MSDTPPAPATPDTQTVEQVVRAQLAQALGGRRGMVEAAVPTIMFTLLWLTTRELRIALVVSVAAALVLLVVRLVQRSSVQFVEPNGSPTMSNSQRARRTRPCAYRPR